jgi:dTDP-4-dehydrorhamnose reductase
VAPTSAAELAQKINELIRTSHFGLFHLTNQGECTWHQFAQEIFSLLGRKPRLEGVDSQTFGARARRPLYSVLGNMRAKEIGLSPFSPRLEALRSYLKKKGYLT